MLLACRSVHLQTKKGKKALSTVAEEISDNLHQMIKRFRRATGGDPHLVMDNARIQSCIDENLIESNYGDIELPTGCRDKLPPHSPDFNQPAEQTIAAVKGDVIGQVADFAQAATASSSQITPEQLTKMGERARDKFAAGDYFRRGVEKSVYKMPEVYAIVGADEDEEVVVSGGRTLQGTAGDWPPSEWR